MNRYGAILLIYFLSKFCWFMSFKKLVQFIWVGEFISIHLISVRSTVMSSHSFLILVAGVFSWSVWFPSICWLPQTFGFTSSSLAVLLLSLVLLWFCVYSSSTYIGLNFLSFSSFLRKQRSSTWDLYSVLTYALSALNLQVLHSMNFEKLCWHFSLADSFFFGSK
jgi:hypothetical protein